MLGVSEFKAAIEASVARQLAATGAAVGRGAHLIEGKIKEKLSDSGSSGQGRDSKGRFTKGETSSSPPGSPPYLVSGTLRRSVTVQGPAPEGAGFKASVGPTAVYGRIQELGGVAGRGARLPARPYVRPAIVESGEELHALFREAWSKW